MLYTIMVQCHTKFKSVWHLESHCFMPYYHMYMYLCLLYFAWANQRCRQCYICHTAQFMWRRAQYSTARDNGDSCSLSYTGKQGR